jgi:hypothetical protein
MPSALAAWSPAVARPSLSAPERPGPHRAALLALPGTRMRPLGADRCGLRLRIEVPGAVENPGKDHDVHLAWQDSATTVDELRVQMRLLVGCPVHGTDAGRLDGTAS